MNNPFANMKLPGTVWFGGAILLVLFLQQNFENAYWYQIVVFLIYAAVKGVDVKFEDLVRFLPEKLRNRIPDDDSEAAGTELPSVTLTRGFDEPYSEPAEIIAIDDATGYGDGRVWISEPERPALVRWLVG